MRRTHVGQLRHWSVGLAILLVGGLLTVVAAVRLSAQPGSIMRVSVNDAGAEANDDSFFPALSSDGRIIGFKTRASNLDDIPPEDLQFDVFVHDRENGQTTRVSLDSFGFVGNDNSFPPALDDDGSQVAFASSASNMVPGDTNGGADVFVRNRGANTTEAVSLTVIGTLPVSGGSRDLPPSITGDGRLVAFETTAILTPNDPNTILADAYVRNRDLGVTELISVRTVSSDPVPAFAPAISRNGCIVAFVSASQRLIPQAQDTNERLDVYVRDRCADPPFTQRISRGVDGEETTRDSQESLFPPALDDEGNRVAFESQAINLVPNDTNNVSDVFVHDRLEGVTERISVNSYGDQGDAASSAPAISGDGRFVVFSSLATNFTGATPGRANIYVRDRQSNATCQVSLGDLGSPSTGDSVNPAISRDGRWIAFESTADLLPGGTPGRRHIYIVENIQENQACPEPATPTPTVPAPTQTPDPDLDCCQCPDEFCELPGDGSCPEGCDVVFRAACVSSGCVTFTPTPEVTPTRTPDPEFDCCQCPDEFCELPGDGSCPEGCEVIYRAACLDGSCRTFTPTPDGPPTPTLGPDDCCDCPEDPDLCVDPSGNECPGSCTGVYGAACLGASQGCVANTPTRTPTPTIAPGDDDCCNCPENPDLCTEPSGGTCPEGCDIAYDAACLGAPQGCIANTPTRTPTPTIAPGEDDCCNCPGNPDLCTEPSGGTCPEGCDIAYDAACLGAPQGCVANTPTPTTDIRTPTMMAATATPTTARTSTAIPNGGGGGGCNAGTGSRRADMGVLELLVLFGPLLLVRRLRRRAAQSS